MSKEEQQFHLDHEVRRGVPQAEGVLSQSSSVVQAIARYFTSLVLRCDGASDQFNPGAGAGPSAEAYILCEQSIARAEGEVPGPREGSYGSGVLSYDTSPLLSKLYNGGDDRLSYPQGLAKTGCGEKDGTMGSGTLRVRCPVRAPRSY